jgi:CheY-like chemotaxis protein
MSVRKKILLVDDTATILAMEKLILGDGYDYTIARNGSEAMDRALADEPDLILMDLNMPVKDGLEALRDLKAGQETAAIPVVIVTTRGEPDSVALCRSLGCSDFVTKPIDGDQLVNAVKRILEA